ncbi:MAG TPA: epoxyqueuosine reductase, partial [Sphingomonas sp.]
MDEHKPLADRIKAKAAELGFAAAGIAAADAAPRAAERLRAWLAEGAHGDMIWMEARADQ